MSVTQSTVFNTLLLEFHQSDNIARGYIVNIADENTPPHKDYTSRFGYVFRMAEHHVHNTDDSVHIEVLRRVRNGTCDVYLRKGGGNWIPYDDFPPQDIGYQLNHRFHPDRHLQGLWEFFHGLKYTEATDTEPERLSLDMKFVHAGEVEPTLTAGKVYTRNDATPDTPSVMPYEDETEMFTALETAGWHREVPVGPRRLHVLDFLYNADQIILGTPMRAYRHSDHEARIRAIAKTYHAWESALTDTDTGPTYASTKQWWRGWVGRCWHSRTFTSSEFIFYEGMINTAQERTYMDVPDWMMGHMELWLAEPNGIEDFRTRHNRQLLQVELTDYTFAHVKLSDGSIGDKLSNGQQRLDETQWLAFQNAKYTEALGTT